MKRFIIHVLAVVGILGLAGCGQQIQNDMANPTENIEKSIQTDAQTESQTESEQSTKPEIAEPYISIRDFSYAEDCEIYVDGEPGVKTSGFVNTADVDIDLNNVVEVAKNECTVKWDTVNVYLDTSAGIWKVVFFTGCVERDGYIECVAGGDQSVYLDYDGKTVLIVYGE